MMHECSFKTIEGTEHDAVEVHVKKDADDMGVPGSTPASRTASGHDEACLAGSLSRCLDARL